MIENTAYIGLSRQLVLRRQMDVIANNLANMNTTAYKSQDMLFAEHLVEQSGKSDKLSFVNDVSMFRKTQQGPLLQTGNQLDLAIEGKGYLVVDGANGPRYTRNGQLSVNNDGVLTTRTGEPVLDIDSQTIIVDPSDRRFLVNRKGLISNSQGPLAQLKVVEFNNEQNMKAQGNSLYITNEEPIPSEQARIQQGMLEQSNVTPISEMTGMMKLLRSYQSMGRLMNENDEMRKRGIRAIGSVT